MLNYILWKIPFCIHQQVRWNGGCIEFLGFNDMCEDKQVCTSNQSIVGYVKEKKINNSWTCDSSQTFLLWEKKQYII